MLARAQLGLGLNNHALSVPQAPWALAVFEAALMLLLYFTIVSDAIIVRKPILAVHYSFKHSLEDVLLFSVARDVAVILAYCLWSRSALPQVGVVPLGEFLLRNHQVRQAPISPGPLSSDGVCIQISDAAKHV